MRVFDKRRSQDRRLQIKATKNEVSRQTNGVSEIRFQPGLPDQVYPTPSLSNRQTGPNSKPVINKKLGSIFKVLNQDSYIPQSYQSGTSLGGTSTNTVQANNTGGSSSAPFKLLREQSLIDNAFLSSTSNVNIQSYIHSQKQLLVLQHQSSGISNKTLHRDFINQQNKLMLQEVQEQNNNRMEVGKLQLHKRMQIVRQSQRHVNQNSSKN